MLVYAGITFQQLIMFAVCLDIGGKDYKTEVRKTCRTARNQD
jgi:hypothetical protein